MKKKKSATQPGIKYRIGSDLLVLKPDFEAEKGKMKMKIGIKKGFGVTN